MNSMDDLLEALDELTAEQLSQIDDIAPGLATALTRLAIDRLANADCYDAIEVVRAHHPSGSPAVQVANAAKHVADLWNDPPRSMMQRDIVRDVFEELADALDELLGGGPSS